jgi:NADH-quinone oxidoreductase subunit I
MPIPENEVKWVQNQKMGFLDRLYLPAILQGLGTTLKHMFGKRVTQQFPEERPKLPANYRGVHRLNRDEEGRVKCVACYMCSTACPARCIDIVAAPSPWPDREKYPEVFVIDELRCIYCGMCEQACPCDAIELTTLFDLTGLSREEMMFDKEKLLSVFDQTVAMGTDPIRTQRGPLSIASEPKVS